VPDFSDHDRRLDAAVALGIISAEQAAQIRALTPQRAPQQHAAPIGASLLAYALGAITVLVAMGWFLADRWESLGAEGVLAVVVVYGGLFTAVARRMRREGFAFAEGVAAFLTVLLVPLAVVALSEILPWFPQEPSSACNARGLAGNTPFDFWACHGLELTIEFATLAAAALAWRITRFSPFALLVGGIAMRLVFVAAVAITGGPNGVAAMAWLWMICASLATAAAYQLDRQPAGEHDIAHWVHLLAVFASAVASVTLPNQFDGLRHLLLGAAFIAFAFSLRMRRGLWTLLGLAWFVSYLGWLANEVFRDSPVFPIILAALGIGVIVVTVWIQRNRERLIARFGGVGSGEIPSFPGGLVILLLPIAVAAWRLPDAVQLDRAEAAEVQAGRVGRDALLARRRRAAQGDTTAAVGGDGVAPAAPPETTPVRRP
jgi:hypothetical protein